MIAAKRILFPLAFAFFSMAQTPQTAPAENPQVDRNKLVELTGIEVSGTRLPVNSVIRLSGLKVGQMVNYAILSDASNKITSTGLVSAVDYAYNVTPGKPGVVVSLKLWDEMPLLPAKITPEEDTGQIWGCLQSADPVFAKSLPNTAKALEFYSQNIDRCFDQAGLHNVHASPSVVCDENKKPAEIVFHIEGTQTQTQTAQKD